MIPGLLKQLSNTDGQPWETRQIPIFLITIFIVLTALMAAPPAHAASSYLNTWSNLYPGSQSDNNASCQICHGSSTQNINPYGFAMATCNGASGNISQRIQAVEGQDSDGQGDSNLTEIDADAQPGWTTGAMQVWTRNNCSPNGTNTYPGNGAVDPVATEPNIAVAPTTLAFGIVDVGNSNTLTTTITNNGTAVLNVTALNLSGTNEFSLSTAPNTPFNVAANGGTATIDVVYTPVDNGADSGSLTIASNDPDQPTVTVNLTGTGNVVVANACNFAVAPAALAFGNLDTGTSATLSTTVTNSGNAACNIAATVTGSGDFALTTGSPVTVAANGGTASVSVSYSPAATGADVGNLNLTSDDNNNPQNLDVPLSGNGVAPQVDTCDFSAAPILLSFGGVNVGSSSTLSTTVTNNGTAACNIAASFSVASSNAFTLNTASPVTVAANGGTASVSVSYAPTAAGADAGTLSLVSNDATNPQTVNVQLSGSGFQNAADTDGDGVGDDIDNCTLVANGPTIPDAGGNSQRDTDGDGYGNICDPDLSNDLNVNATDLAIFKPLFFTADLDADFDGSSTVNAADLAIMKAMFFKPPGPSCVDNPGGCAGAAGLTARGDTYATPVGDTLAITASRVAGVLYNDFGGVAPLTAQLVSGPSAGSLDAFAADGSFTYTPGGAMIDNTTDHFTYIAIDANGVESLPATVVLQTLSKQTDFKILMNYELGMHCTGFEFAYCCVLPPYNSIIAQVVKPALGDAAEANGSDTFVDGFPRMLEGSPVEGLDGLGRETVVRDWDSTNDSFKKYQLRYYHDAQPRQEGNTSKPNTSTLISAAEGNSLQYFNTVFDSAAPDGGNALVYGEYNGLQNVIQGDGSFTGPTDNYANGWLNHFYIYGNLEGHDNTGLEADKVRLGVAGQVEYPPNSGAGLQPLGPTGNGLFENVLTFSADTGTVVFTQAKVLEDLPIMLTSPRIWEALGMPLTPFEDTIGFFADPGAVDEDTVRPFVAMKASLHEYPSGNAVTGSNGQPVIGFGTAPIDIPNCERCHSAPSIDPLTGNPNVNSPNWNRPDAFYPHTTGTVPFGTGLEEITNLEINFWQAYYDIIPGVDSTWYSRLKGAAINMLTLHDYDVGTSFTANYAGTECVDPNNCIGGPLTNETDIPQNTRLGGESVICQRCHADNVIANVKSATFDVGGQFPIKPISEAIHNTHRNQSEDGVIVFNDSLGRDGGCQGCHPAHRSDGVMDDYPITLGGNNANAGDDNRLNLGGCFVGRDVHSNPMKDVDGAETPTHLNAIGEWLADNVTHDQGDPRGIWCTNCHTQLGQELWRTEDCNDLVHGDCLVNPRAEPTLADVAAAVGLTEQQAIDYLDPKVDGFDRTSDQTHTIWAPASVISDANIATIEIDGGGNPVVTTDADGDISVNILSFCTTDDCVARINANPGDQSQWRYPANPFIDPVNNSGFPVPFSAATDGRDHWLSAGEPHCADCHQAPYVEQSGNITAYPPFNYPAKASLMRYTRGHQDISCQGCHESIHGLYPVTPTIDTTSYAQAAALNNDGSHGPLKCASCHTHVDADEIPTWVDNLRYNDPTTPGNDRLLVSGNFDRAVGWMHTYTDEADPNQDVCRNCHGSETPDVDDRDYLEHAMQNRTSRDAMDAAERAVNNGQVFGETAGDQRDALCSECHGGENELGEQECDREWREHLIEGRVSQVVWEELSAPLGGCGW